MAERRPNTSLSAATVHPAFAGPNLVSNGGFETNTGNGEVDFNTTASPWTVPGATDQKYTFLWNTGAGASGTTADTTGALGSLGTVRLWGPGSLIPSANGLTLSQNGGAFVGADGAFQDEPIQQTITGLVAGHTYALTFDWAAAQQFGFLGPTSSGWDVSLGAETFSTGNHGHWEPWLQRLATVNLRLPCDRIKRDAFVPLYRDRGSGLTAVLAAGRRVVDRAVPEPSTWAMMALGFGLLGYAGYRRRRTAISIV